MLNQQPPLKVPPTYVDLVDAGGHRIGEMEKMAAHTAPGVRHRAFSLFLTNEEGELLLQRRASVKYHSPRVWSNTCCGHPASGADPVAAAKRRVMEELGVKAREVEVAGVVEYRLVDPKTGLVEHEFNHTLVGLVAGEPMPAPQEVDTWTYADARRIDSLRRNGELSIWFDSVYAVARPILERRTGRTW